MDIVELEIFCLSFPHTTEEFPFDETTWFQKVFNKCSVARISCRSNGLP